MVSNASWREWISVLRLVWLWCLFVCNLVAKSHEILMFVCLQKDAKQSCSQSSVALMVPVNNCCHWPTQRVQLSKVASQHCLASFWRQTNIKISWDLATRLQTNISTLWDSRSYYNKPTDKCGWLVICLTVVAQYKIYSELRTINTRRTCWWAQCCHDYKVLASPVYITMTCSYWKWPHLQKAL